jgi:hypothetical protein
VNRKTVEEIVAKVRHLQFVTRNTGFVTGRSQKELLQKLNAEELALAGELLQNPDQQD